MARSPQQESKFGNFLGRLGARYTRWVRSTATTVIYDPPDAHARAVALHPYIFAMWHGQFVLMPTLHEGAFKVSAIAARHRDAAAIRTLLGEFDIEVVAGAGANDRKRDKGGASALRTLTEIFLPLMAPALAAAGLLAFILAWNEFLFALTFTLSNEQRTVPVAIALITGASAYELPWGRIMAASVIVTVPLVLLVLILQRHIVSGLIAGAVKG